MSKPATIGEPLKIMSFLKRRPLKRSVSLPPVLLTATLLTFSLIFCASTIARQLLIMTIIKRLLQKGLVIAHVNRLKPM